MVNPEPLPPPSAVSTAAEPGAFPYTDHGNAERVFRLRGEDLRWVSAWKKWLVWDGRRWAIDDKERPTWYVSELMREMGHQALDAQNQEALKWAVKSLGRQKLQDAATLLKSFPGISVSTDDWDDRDEFLNCHNGTLHLPSGRLGAHRREDLLTKIVQASYDPHATCPRWLGFLDEIMGGDQEMVKFLQRAVGYSLGGGVGEKCFFFLHGENGDNGKSVFIETILWLLGDYSTQTTTETFMAKQSPGQAGGNEIARLRGARFVAAPETESGKRISESLLKQLTGGDTITARFLYGEFFEFPARMKIWITGNHEPKIIGQDDAIWRRVQKIPFHVTIPKEQQDRQLPEKLRREADGILAWAYRGYQEWAAVGLGQPEKVRAAVQEYRQEQDVVARFLEECVDVGDAFEQVERGLMYTAFQVWGKFEGVRFVMDQAQFSRTLTQRHKIEWTKSNGAKYWSGVSLRPEWADNAKRSRQG